jgi:cold shock CspA family protein
LDEGMEVEFDILDSDKGPKAINIIKVPAPGVDACP